MKEGDTFMVIPRKWFKTICISLILVLVLGFILATAVPALAFTSTTGGTTSSMTPAGGGSSVEGFQITTPANGTITSIGVNWHGVGTGHVMVALYSAGSSKPASLLTQSASTPVSAATGWQDISVTSYNATAGTYWVAIEWDNYIDVYYSTGSPNASYYSKTYGTFDTTWSSSSTQYSNAQWNMRVTYVASTTTVVTSSLNPSNYGNSVTFTANVTSGSGTPTGTVQFTNNGSNLGSAVALNGSGIAQYSTSALTAGTHTITGVYSGDSNYATSTGTLSGGQVVNSVASTISITAPGNFSFATFTMGADNTASSTNGTVTYSQGSDNSTGWQVTATDNNTGANTGHMLRTTDSHPLTGKLQISKNGGSSYSDANSTLTYTGSASGQYTFNAKQNITSTELRGSYAITIKFTGSVTY